MRKQHGPDLTRKVKPISRCVTCHGRGVVKPLFYEVECTACDGAGFVDKVTGESLGKDDAPFQMRAYIARLESQVATLQRMQPYESSNRRGPHGSHRTGD